MSHQSRAVEIAREKKRFAFFLGCGLGKSISVLSIITDQMPTFDGKTLILAPKSVAHSAWGGDAAKFFPSLRIFIMDADTGTKQKKSKLIQAGDYDVVITNYEQFKIHADDFIKAGVRRLVVDESSKIKSHDSQISKACHAFSDKMDAVYLLSGTPAPNNQTEYWSQIRCIDKDLFGASFYQFANNYFFPIKRMIGGVMRIIAYSPRKVMQDEFLDKLRSVSWSLTKEEALDLPEQMDVTREVVMSDDELKAYIRAVSEGIIEIENAGFSKVAAAAVGMKLRQITGGAVNTPSGLQRIGESKVKETMSVLEEIGPQNKVVIWAEFTNEIDRLREAIEASGRSVGVIDGRVDSADRLRLVEEFQGGELQTLVCHPKAAGHGITLTAASYMIYFSHGYSYEEYQQSRDRIHRNGQRNVCTYFHIVSKGTIDEEVIKTLMRKQSAQDAVFDALKIPVFKAA